MKNANPSLMKIKTLTEGMTMGAGFRLTFFNAGADDDAGGGGGCGSGSEEGGGKSGGG